MGIKPLTLPLAIVRWSSYHVSISLAIIPFHSKKLPWGLTFSCFVPFAHTRSWHYIALPVGHSLKGKVTPNLWQCGFCQEAQETTKHVLWSCPFAQQVWNKVMSLFLTINVDCLFSWGSMMWGVLHSNLMLYEANDVHEAMTIHNRILILVGPFRQPRKQVRSVQIWKIVTTLTLWALWKYRCNRLYDMTDIHLSDVLLEIWEN